MAEADDYLYRSKKAGRNRTSGRLLEEAEIADIDRSTEQV